MTVSSHRKMLAALVVVLAMIMPLASAEVPPFSHFVLATLVVACFAAIFRLLFRSFPFILRY